MVLCRCLTGSPLAPNPALPRALRCLQLGPLVGPSGNPCPDWPPPTVAALAAALSACPALHALDLYGTSEHSIAALQAAWAAGTRGGVLLEAQGEGCVRLRLPGFDVDGPMQWPTAHVLPAANVVLQRQQQPVGLDEHTSCVAAPATVHQDADQEADSQPHDQPPPHVPVVSRPAQRISTTVCTAPVTGVWNPLEQERAAAAQEALLAEEHLPLMPQRRSMQPGRQVCTTLQCLSLFVKVWWC